MKDMTKWIDYAEASRIANRTSATIYRWAKIGKVETVVEGRKTLFNKRQILDLAKQGIRRGRPNGPEVRSKSLLILREPTSFELEQVLPDLLSKKFSKLYVFSWDVELADAGKLTWMSFVKMLAHRSRTTLIPFTSTPMFTKQTRHLSGEALVQPASLSEADDLVEALIGGQETQALAVGSKYQEWLIDNYQAFLKAWETGSPPESLLPGLVAKKHSKYGLFTVNTLKEVLEGEYEFAEDESSVLTALERLYAAIIRLMAESPAMERTALRIDEALEALVNDYGYDLRTVGGLDAVTKAEDSVTLYGLCYEISMFYDTLQVQSEEESVND